MTSLARNLRRTGIRADQKLVCIQYRIHRRQQHVRPDISGHKVHVVLLHEFVGLLLTNVWLEAIVFHKQLNVEIAHLVANMLERELD